LRLLNITACKPLGIAADDHLIVGLGGQRSMKAMALFEMGGVPGPVARRAARAADQSALASSVRKADIPVTVTRLDR